jgi:hypothetical protein
MNTNNVVQLVIKSNTLNAVKITENGHKFDGLEQLLDFETAREIKQSKGENLTNSYLAEVYGDTDVAFQEMIDLLAIDYEYFDNMDGNDDLQIIFGYVLTILRSTMASSCGLHDDVSDHLVDIVQTVKASMNNNDSC